MAELTYAILLHASSGAIADRLSTAGIILRLALGANRMLQESWRSWLDGHPESEYTSRGRVYARLGFLPVNAPRGHRLCHSAQTKNYQSAFTLGGVQLNITGILGRLAGSSCKNLRSTFVFALTAAGFLWSSLAIPACRSSCNLGRTLTSFVRRLRFPFVTSTE